MPRRSKKNIEIGIVKVCESRPEYRYVKFLIWSGFLWHLEMSSVVITDECSKMMAQLH